MERRNPHPMFFVSIASKGLRLAVSLLFATLAGRSISIAGKGLTGRLIGEKVTRMDEKTLGELEGLPDGRAWFVGHGVAYRVHLI
jgi:hypothetical protein